MAKDASETVNSKANLYEILELKDRNATSEQIKNAYRKALLQHHPDKKTSKVTKWSIDQVAFARQVLLDTNLRKEYDRTLLFEHSATQEQPLPLNPTELETVDLDDMEFSEATGRWFRLCRCGNKTAYEFTEQDLEEELAAKAGSDSRRGEILVGCGDCSLYIKIVFEALDDPP